MGYQYEINGKTIEFDAQPTEADIDEAARMLGTHPAAAVVPAKEPGIVQSLAQDLSKPFLSLAASGVAGAKGLQLPYMSMGEGGISDVRSVDPQLDTVRNGVDFGYFGKVKPAAGAFSDSDMSIPSALKSGVTDAVANAGQIVSYGATPLKIASKTTALSALLNPAALKSVAPFAAPFAIGMAAQKAEDPEATAGDVIAEGLGSYAGAAAGFNLLNAGGQLLGNLGGRLFRSAIAKSAFEQLNDLAGRAGEWVNSFQRQELGKTLDYSRVQFGQDVDNGLLNATNAAYTAVRQQLPKAEEFLADIQAKMRSYVGVQYANRDSLFSNVLDGNEVLTSSRGTLANAVERASAFINSNVANRSLLRSNYFDEIGNLQNYIASIGDAPTSLRDAYRLYTSANNYIGGNPEVNAQIRNVSRSILGMMEDSIKAQKPELLQAWNVARSAARDVEQNVDTVYTDKITAAASINNMTDALLHGTAPEREQLNHLINAFSNKQDKQVLSQMFFNSIVDKAQAQPTLAGQRIVLNDALKWVTQNVDSRGNSLMQPWHIGLLQNLNDLASTNFGSFMKNAQATGKLGGLTPDVEKLITDMRDYDFVSGIANATKNFSDYSMLGNRISSIQSEEELNAVLGLLDGHDEEIHTLGKEIIRGVVERNSSSIARAGGQVTKENMASLIEGFIKDIDSIGGTNKQAIFNKLFGSQSVKFENLKDPVPLDQYILDVADALKVYQGIGGFSSSNALIKAGHLFTGLMYGMTGKPVPAIYHMSRGVSLTGGGADITEEAVRSLPSVVRSMQLAIPQEVSGHLTSAQQILDDMPEEILTKNGGLTGLLDSTKQNIILSLKRAHMPDAAEAVNRVATKGMNTMAQFKEAVGNAISPVSETSEPVVRDSIQQAVDQIVNRRDTKTRIVISSLRKLGSTLETNMQNRFGTLGTLVAAQLKLGYSLNEMLTGAAKMLGRALTPEEQKQIEDDYHAQ